MKIDMNLPLLDGKILNQQKFKFFADPEDEHRSHRIRKAILEAGNQLRAEHPWLVKYQDQIGMGILITSVTGIIFNITQYARGKMPWYVAVSLSAFWMSILHELEHDLIHQMYYRKNKKINNAMLATVYAFRPSTINPWTRRDIHLHHHKSSGTPSDVEERGINNGDKWDFKRLITTGDNLLAILLRPLATLDATDAYANAQKNLSFSQKLKVKAKLALGYTPFGNVHYGLWYSFLFMSLAKVGMKALSIKPPSNVIWRAVDKTTKFYAVAIAAPNFLRTLSLHFTSSNLHYYGDVENGNTVQQCQIWTDWRMKPLQAFCFNFGGTHAIHHFVVRDTFYIRQAIAKKCYPVMRENGVRFNDFGTFKRANRRLETV